ncbi:MAG: hypothetical protein NPIRA04_22190 [Nitrospirales bacterium]|nr:MAG: hypothetical protein NPIRA04_22190 [Nitrospirales bacterium]
MADQLTATQNTINVIAGNKGLNFNAAQLKALNAGILVLNSPTDFKPKCITHLRYQNDDKDLQQITLDDGTFFTNTTVTNLNEFRETLRDAACCGHGITFCLDREEKRMFMLNVYPCKCKCRDRDND